MVEGTIFVKKIVFFAKKYVTFSKKCHIFIGAFFSITEFLIFAFSNLTSYNKNEKRILFKVRIRSFVLKIIMG